jgi:hypothetical protein
MPLTPEQIRTFEKALAGQSPAFDKNWAITKKLLKLVVLQSNQILDLQAELEAVDRGNEMAVRSLAKAIQQAANGNVARTGLSEQDARQAMAHLDNAIAAYQQGKAVTEYAGQVLKFAAFLL